MSYNNNNIVAGVDIGSNKIIALIGVIEEQELKVIGVGKVKVNAVNSEGAIINIDDLKNKLELAIEEAEKMADYQVDNIYINLFGNNVKCFTGSGIININDDGQGISHDDLSRVLSDVKNNIVIPDGYEIIHILARNFCVDEMTGIKDPVGMRGSRLEAEVYVVTAASGIIDNLEKCVDSAGFDIKDFVYEPLASAEAVLTDDEKKLGTVVVDIGGANTTMAVYKNGSIIYSNVIDMGSSSITNDLAIILRTSFEEAEKLKIKYGNLYSMDNESDRIELFNTSRESVKIVTKKHINEIIFARIEEIFKLIYENLEREELLEEIKAGIIVTGAGSSLEGLPVFIEHLFEMACRCGKPLSLKGLFDKINSPVYSTAVGILKYAKKSHENTVNIKSNLIKKLIYKTKNFFDTYF